MGATVVKAVLKRKTGEATYEQVMGAVVSGGPSAQRNVNEWAPMSGVTTKKAGKRVYGGLSVEAAWDPADASHTAILDAIQDDTPTTDEWELATSQVTKPGGKFSGVITSYGLNIPNSGFITMKFDIGMASGVTKGAATAVVPNAAYDPEVADGSTMTYAAAAVAGWDNFEISGLTRALVTSTPVPDDAPTGGPSNTRTRGNFVFDLLFDDAAVAHQTLETDAGAANTAKVFVITLPGGKTITFSGCISGWDESGQNAKDSHNRVRVSGYCTTDLVVA